ncbi:MAG: hypothetical protein ACRDWD_08045 [Acidimicrobiia bacterium]
MDFSDILAAIRRRWRIVLVCVLLAAVAAGVFVFTREQSVDPTTFRSTVNVIVPSSEPLAPSEDGRQSSPVSANGLPFELQRGQEGLALSPPVRTQALERSGLPPNDPSVSFSVSLNDEAGLMALSATTRDLETSRTLAENYGLAYREARRRIVYQDLLQQQRSRRDRLQELQTRLRAINRDLSARFGPLPQVVPAPPDGESFPAVELPPGVIDLATTQQFYERAALTQSLFEGNIKLTDLSIETDKPSPFAAILDPASTARLVDETPSPVVPSAVIVAAGLVLGLALALVRDRLDPSVRSAKVAAAALSAPVLATVPPPKRLEELAVLERPRSERSEAFRTLAATCVATDRLPKAIVVSTPRGDTLDDVAANFAAALASLGLKVALVATSPDQSWFARLFGEPEDGGEDPVTLPELLTEAHEHRLNGKVTRRLPLTDFTPNLLLVPPGPVDDLALPLDGLPPLLRALDDAGVDVTVIAGPPLLDDSNATIVAWATGTVLWAVQVDRLTQDEASEAAARLELTGVTSFGVVVVGATES